jgi:lipoxygenase homology domain-containing protein 1
LGKINKIILGHDNTGLGPGWMVESVTVHDSKNREWFFPISRWFAKNEDDGLIERELTPSNEEPLNVVSYEVVVFTGDRWGAGKIYIHFYFYFYFYYFFLYFYILSK